MKCTDAPKYEELTPLNQCIIGEGDSLACYDSRFDIIKFYFYKTNDGTCRGITGNYSQKANKGCYPDGEKASMWSVENAATDG